MERKPPTPVCTSFLLCRMAIQALRRRGEVSLIGITDYVVSAVYPVLSQLGAFARLVSGHGSYRLELQLQDMEGAVVWGHMITADFEMADPLRTYDCLVYDLQLVCPKPGKYDLILLVDGKEIARYPFYAYLPQQAPA